MSDDLTTLALIHLVVIGGTILFMFIRPKEYPVTNKVLTVAILLNAAFMVVYLIGYFASIDLEQNILFSGIRYVSIVLLVITLIIPRLKDLIK